MLRLPGWFRLLAQHENRGTLRPVQCLHGRGTSVPENAHQWATVGTPQAIPADAVKPAANLKYMRFQVCQKCGYQRVLLTKDAS